MCATLFLNNEMRQKYNFCCVSSRRHWKIIATYSWFFMCFNKRGGKIIIRWTKWLLKCYWKVENVLEVQRHWRVEFGTPPTRLTVTRIRDKFEVDGTVQDVLKGRCGRKRSSTDNESAHAVMQVFVVSTMKSLRQFPREIGVEKPRVLRILRAQKWKPYIPRLVHETKEDDSDRRLQFYEWILHKCDEWVDFQD